MSRGRSFAAYLGAVAAAERKAPRRAKRRVEWTPEREAQLKAARPSPEELRAAILAAPRCEAIANGTGNRCKNAAIRGATRCRKHGGLRQVPAHPANIKAFRSGKLIARLAYTRAAIAWANASQEAREAVMGAAPPPRDIIVKADGAAAFEASAADNGRAWRDWCANRKKKKS